MTTLLSYSNIALGGFNVGSFTFGHHHAVSLAVGLFGLFVGVLLGEDR